MTENDARLGRLLLLGAMRLVGGFPRDWIIIPSLDYSSE